MAGQEARLEPHVATVGRRHERDAAREDARAEDHEERDGDGSTEGREVERETRFELATSSLEATDGCGDKHADLRFGGVGPAHDSHSRG